MMKDQRPIGLRGVFGGAAWNAIEKSYAGRDVDPYFPGTPFAKALDELWKTFHENGTFPRPREALDFITNHIVPVMDLNEEAQCYQLCTALRHFEIISVDPAEIAAYDGLGDMFQGFRKKALLDLLKIPEVQGTTLEQYLKYPFTLPAVFRKDTELFSFAHA